MYRQDQIDIMNYEKGTIGIVAVPGAGKTFIITNLVAKLLSEKSNILVVTYMNSGVNNFKSRIKSIFKINNCSSYSVMTIHSLALQIVKEDTRASLISDEFKVVDEFQKYMILNECIKKWREDGGERIFKWFLKDENNINHYELWEMEFSRLVASTISEFKIKNFDTNIALNCENYKGILRCIIPIFDMYEKEMNKLELIDYDDILVLALDILKRDECIREKFQNKYDYVFEDECQDSNKVQNEILEILSQKHNNLVRVGDINQSINKTFSSSDPRYFKSFLDKADIVYKMYMSNRSCEEIMDIANHFMEFVKRDNRLEDVKDALEEIYIKGVPKGVGYKENPIPNNYPIYSRRYLTFEEEIDDIINKLERFKNKSVALLVPFNSQIKEIVEKLEEKNILYEDLSSTSKQRRKVVVNMGAILKFINDPLNIQNIVDIIINVFLKSSDDKEDITKLLNNKKPLDILKLNIKCDNENLKNIIIDIVDILNHSNMPIEKYILYICEKLKLKDNELMIGAYISFYAKVYNLSLQELEEVLLDDRHNAFNVISDLVYDMNGYKPKIGIPSICTYHKAKGLEWDCVFLMDITKFKFPDSIFQKFQGEYWYLRDSYKNPLNKAKNDIDKFLGQTSDDFKLDIIRERIRLLYVGMTRAKEYLFITSNKKRNFAYKEEQISLFFKELHDYHTKRYGEKYGR